MLYPITTIPLAAMPGLNLIDAGSLLAVPLTLPAASALLLAMVQVAPTQDYSLRGWLSATPGGQFLPTSTAYWHLDRGNDQRIAVYDYTRALPDGLGSVYPLPLPPGDYCLNVLNLVNSENVFSFSSTLLSC